ncbi:hypothetical protein [Mycolicibacterium canariasense]|nr:hypothetical protein [Mycolicibacterium canariasense]
MISFVIPTLNEEKTLERTLRNVTSFSGEHEVIGLFMIEGVERSAAVGL